MNRNKTQFQNFNKKRKYEEYFVISLSYSHVNKQVVSSTQIEFVFLKKDIEFWMKKTYMIRVKDFIKIDQSRFF